ncbi:hypothetical protein FHT44_005202 [Mycolicibacterium sp. BK634]|uniref:hypothetical protein n=1 Tax=Mycolicibacterium sp. BK634 TaxID=2587099 RepID=UPI00160C5634|nr:hypothetical protein [Mycolicibacterium sp. BK634]MBB3752690.1 hypothetical protein [Mycolicibacterium sp. BK634]
MKTDIVMEAIKAACLEKPWEWEPKHPQYVEGALYLTQEQWNAIKAAFPPADDADGRWSSFNRPSACWGIPVRLISEDEPTKLPSGKELRYSKLLQSFIIVDPDKIPKVVAPMLQLFMGDDDAL